MRYITLDPYIPLALWVPLAVAAASLLAWYAAVSRGRLPRRRWPGVVALMALAVAVPLAILLNPTWLEQIPPPAGKPLLTIAVDRSASMAARDMQDGRTRYEVACRLAEQFRGRLAEQYEIRTLPFAAEPSSAGSQRLSANQPVGMATDLAAAIENALDEARPQGQAILLISDGIHNAVGGTGRVRQSVAKAKAMAAPVYVTTLGGQAGVRDLAVRINLPQELAFVGQRVPVAVSVRQRGSLADRTTLSLDCDGEVVEQREVGLTPDGISEEVFHVRQDTGGLYRYELRADPLPEEVTEVNNTATLVVRVVDQPVRVLLLEGKPYWDTKFLVRTLSRDPSVELVSVVQLAEGRLLRRTISRPAADEADSVPEGRQPGANGAAAASGPDDGDRQPEPKPVAVRTDDWAIETDAGAILADKDALAGFQIVVLGRNAEVFLSDEAVARLKKWLIEGDGSLVCFRGPPASQITQRLGELMPVRWSPLAESRFRVQLTSAGRALRWLAASEPDDDVLSSLPSLATVTRAESPKPLAVVLAESVSAAEDGQRPVITHQPVGSGRVVVVEGAGMWRWAFLPPEHQQHDEVYGQLWRSLVRWLVANVGLLPSQQLALRTDKVTFTTSENAVATLLLREGRLEGEVPQVELSGGSLRRPRVIRPVPHGSFPGQFRVPLGRLAEGRYVARVAGDEDQVSAVATFDVRGNLTERLEVRARPDLMRLIAETSGGAVLSRAEPERLTAEFEGHLVRSRPERTAETTAWDRWWLLVGAFMIWGAAWGLRRGSGLV